MSGDRGQSIPLDPAGYMMTTQTRAGRQSQPTARFAEEQWRAEEERRRRRRRAVGRDIGGAHDQAEEGAGEEEEIQDLEGLVQMGVGDEDGRIDLRPFINPIVPGPVQGPPPVDAEGWSQIDTWDTWMCAASCSQLLEDVPSAYRKAWSSALSTILTRVNQALVRGDADQTNRALKWLLLLPKLLLRKPSRGGQRGQGSGEISSRFEAVRERNWGALLPSLGKDEKAERQRREKRSRKGRGGVDAAGKEAKLRKTVLGLVSRGLVGRARRMATSHGLADMSDPVVKAAVLDKYPPRRRPMPESVVAGHCMETISCLKETLSNLKPGVSGGFGGLRNEHLRAAAQNWDEREEGQLEEFSLSYLNGTLPPWWYQIWGSVTSFPLYKTAEQDPSVLRPVGVKSSLLRILHRLVVRTNIGALREYLEPCQVALMPGGGAVLVHTVRMMLEHRPDFVCVCLDVRNAHNEISRRAVVEELEKIPELRHLAQHVATCLASCQHLESGGIAFGEAGDGLTQGDSEASGCFCVGWHRWVLKFHNTLKAAGGLAIFGNDDGYGIGPASVVFPALATFTADILEHCSLSLQLSKTKVYEASGRRPTEAPPSMPLAGMRVGDEWLPGFTCYGVEIGSDAYVKHSLGERVQEVVNQVDKVMNLLRNDPQAAWVLLSSAHAHQLDYNLSLQYPTDMLEGAKTMDARLWAALEQVSGQPHIAKLEEGGGVECVLELTGIQQLEGRSFQHLQVPQPVKLGGCGLRSLEETRHPAFIGGLEQALPLMVVGEHQQLPVSTELREVVGGMEGPQRWAEFLAAGSRTAREFQAGWEEMEAEATATWAYLEEEPSGVLMARLDEVGGGSVDGSTRTKIVQQREGMRHQLFTMALKRHPDRQARPVTAFPNIAEDKCAGSWLLATPSPDLSLSARVFREAFSAHLSLASPELRDGGWVGKPVGTRGEVVDKFGDTVMCSNQIAGDSWRTRHDTIKQQIVIEAALAKIPTDCEVYGLFSDLLPAALEGVGGELQWGRARQGKVPDFKFLVPSPEGPVPRLAELKVINAGKTWYPRGKEGRGVERRADGLTKEYERVLRGYDVRFHGAEPLLHGQPEPVPGPLVARFRNYGGLSEGQLVAGPWGDLSPHLHQLLKLFAESRVAAMGRAQGQEPGPGLLGKIMGEIRRSFSVAVVRSQALCLLERLAQLGPGARAAADRRHQTMALDERRRRERQAFAMANQGRGLCRVGRAFVP